MDPPKKAQGYERSRYVYTHNQPMTWIFTRSRLSRLSDSDYKVIPSLKNIILFIIVVFSCPHFSIYDIFYTLENTRSSNKRATHFNITTLLLGEAYGLLYRIAEHSNCNSAPSTNACRRKYRHIYLRNLNTFPRPYF